jgi:hypothetical protein
MAVALKDREIEELRRELESLREVQQQREESGENNNNLIEYYPPEPQRSNQLDEHSATRNNQIGSPQKTNSTIVVVSAEQAQPLIQSRNLAHPSSTTSRGRRN